MQNQLIKIHLHTKIGQLKFFANTVKCIVSEDGKRYLSNKDCELFLKNQFNIGNILPKNEIWVDSDFVVDLLLSENLRYSNYKLDIFISGLFLVGMTSLIDEATGYQNIRPEKCLQQKINGAKQ